VWVRAACTYIDQRMEAGDVDAALHCARRAAEFEPQEDELQHLLIQSLHRVGRRSEALERYELYERALKGDDLEPLDETKALVAEIRGASALPPDAVIGSKKDWSIPRLEEPERAPALRGSTLTFPSGPGSRRTWLPKVRIPWWSGQTRESKDQMRGTMDRTGLQRGLSDCSWPLVRPNA
jgi:hypothetical protein